MHGRSARSLERTDEGRGSAPKTPHASIWRRSRLPGPAALPAALPGADRVAHSDNVALSDALAMNEHPPIAQDAVDVVWAIDRARLCRSCRSQRQVAVSDIPRSAFPARAPGGSPRAPYPGHEEAPASPPGPSCLLGWGLRSPSLRRGRDRRRRRPSPSPGGPRPAFPWSGPSRRWRRRSGGRTVSPWRRPRCPS